MWSSLIEDKVIVRRMDVLKKNATDVATVLAEAL